MSQVCIAVSCVNESASCMETSTCWPSPLASLYRSAVSVPAAPMIEAEMKPCFQGGRFGGSWGSPASHIVPPMATPTRSGAL